MPRPRPPHLHRERTRHGAMNWYVRIGKGPRHRIKQEFGTPEFTAAYYAAIAGEATPTPKKAGAKSGTLNWLVARYRDSAAWTQLSMATRRARENIFRHVIESAGDEPFASINRKTIAAGRDRRKETPFAANDFLKAMRGLFRWAADAGFVKSDPTEGVKGLSRKTEGFHAWTEDEVERFEARWPIGTRERLALAILLYTGLRRGDAAQLGRQHVRNGVIMLRTEKTGTQVAIPILPVLAEIIAATKTGDLAFIATKTGKPMVKEGFGNWFKDACKPPAFRVRLMGCASLARHARQTRARLSRS